ncbi:hypothetical protein PF008_g13577 [Phytophthora fragariae]|uniref:Gem-associated protein 5 n=1 Tax=Phytophthora fragariae TaxID=53985 RepID=A0A6G0RJJ2_9STRA|nr:hypothetical protein PF008_g13577 [Phytophthora fragariae]
MTLGEVEVEVHGARVESGGRGGREFSHGKDHLRLLPPSANWYCSKICDWGRSDDFGLLFAFGAKNSVFIYQVTSGDGRQDSSEDGVKVSFFAQLVRGKRDRRVTAVQFLTDTTGDLRLVCGGEEGSVQIWDVATLTMIEQHRKHKAEVMAVTVSDTLDANFVVAGDRQGRVSAWERDAGKVSVFMPISGDGIHSMAISPHDKALVAVGYRSGVLCLVDAAKGTIRHRLAGHDQEVQCVAWKATVKINDPVVGDEEEGVESDSGDSDVWLASSSRDKSIKVWKLASNLAQEPALDQVLRLPTGKQGMSFTQTKQLWLPVTWSVKDNEDHKAPGKHCLWSGSFDGSLLRWEWSADKSQGQGKKEKKRAPCKPVAVKGGHNRMLFSIVMVPPGRATLPVDDAVSMLTVSLDRELRLWKEGPSSKSGPAATCVEKLTGLGGHAYSVSHNVAAGLVAAGVGDQTIRLWNLGTDAVSTSNDYQCDLLWKGLQSKVTCVRWHPFQHSMLAYGMEDGRIGVYDIQTNKYSHFRTSHDHEVQQLQWIVLQPKSTEDGDDGDSSFLESIKQLEAAQVQGQSLEEALTTQEKQAGSKSCGGNDVRVLLWSRDAGGHVLESEVDATDQKSREGNITEALRIVAKEGALSPTWLSYAPMAGLDVWREMTNLYAHQLDAQGDKKAAALHFLSIAKVRTAITCLVSGEAFREALALIRSRLGAHDPLLQETLWKYSQFLSKRGRHGEAALALLNIGSVQATTRAVHTLVNTGDMMSVKAALDVLLAAVESPASINNHGEDFDNGGGELSFPASFFISNAGQALVKARFDIAETAANLLQSRVVDEHWQFHRKHHNDGLVDIQLRNLLRSSSPSSVRELFEFLTSQRQHEKEDVADTLYSRVLDAFAVSQNDEKLSELGFPSRADHFWSQILSVCQRNGYWFDDEGETRVQEAQDLLVEANCFGDIEKAAAATTERPESAITLLLQVAQRLLRFTIDVMSGSLIGAVEHLRDAFLLLAHSEDTGKVGELKSTSEEASSLRAGGLRLEVMTLLCPCGFASPNVLPQCGELAVEQLDTVVLWSSILLSQCRVVLATAVSTAKNSSTEGLMPSLGSLIGSFLHLLRVSFLGDEETLLCEGLKDVDNQSQLQTLLNEMLVAVHLLPDEPLTSQTQDLGCSAGEAKQDEESEDCVSRKQALIDDMNDVRSCLTWSDDSVK